MEAAPWCHAHWPAVCQQTAIPDAHAEQAAAAQQQQQQQPCAGMARSSLTASPMMWPEGLMHLQPVAGRRVHYCSGSRLLLLSGSSPAAPTGGEDYAAAAAVIYGQQEPPVKNARQQDPQLPDS